MHKTIYRKFLLVVTLLLLHPPVNLADEAPDTGDWVFNLAPFYIWGINIDGDLSAGPATAIVDVSFDDLIDSMEGMFVVHFETLYKRKWGVIIDVDYLDLDNRASLPMGISQDIALNLTLAELSGYYRLHRDKHNFDFILGLRYINIENTVSIVNGPILLDEKKDWTDPLVGVRWDWGFADGWSLIARGDIGGFGLGSDFSWHALGLVEWQPWKNASFIAGYRALDVDYEDGNGQDSFKLDATIHGPVIGLNFKW